jgi:hypothetical protein
VDDGVGMYSSDLLDESEGDHVGSSLVTGSYWWRERLIGIGEEREERLCLGGRGGGPDVI